MGSKKNVTLIPAAVEASAITPDLVHAILRALSLHWDGCETQYDVHLDIGSRDVVAAALITAAFGRGMSHDAALTALRKFAAEVPHGADHEGCVKRINHRLDYVMAEEDSVSDEEMMSSLLEWLDQFRTSPGLRVRLLYEVAMAAVYVRAKQESPDVNVHIEMAFVDATARMVRHTMELCGAEEADRFIACLRTLANKPMKRGGRRAA